MTEKQLLESDDAATRFLQVEEVAQTLVSRLSRLDDESLRYARAATSLDEAAQASRDLVGAVRDVSVSAIQALKVVSSVGGPEILARLESIESRQAENSAALLKKLEIATVVASIAAVLALAAVVAAVIA